MPSSMWPSSLCPTRRRMPNLSSSCIIFFLEKLEAANLQLNLGVFLNFPQYQKDSESFGADNIELVQTDGIVRPIMVFIQFYGNL